MPSKSLSFVIACFLTLSLPICASEKSKEVEVVLLGTGFPRPDPERAGPATAVIVGEKVFVVDTGRGVMLRLAAAGLQPKKVRAVFLTHLHSDHTVGLPDLFTTTWIFGRRTPLEVYGPKGTREMSKALVEFLKADIHIRRDLTEMQPRDGATIRSHTIKEGVVYQDEDVRVTAFLVNHWPVEPAFGYRFDVGGKSIVISGDTRPTPNLIHHAKNADVLVHESYLPEYLDRGGDPKINARLKDYHTSAEEVGQVAEQAGAKLLVITHVVPGNADETFLERIRKHFHGKVVIGHDLMRF